MKRQILIALFAAVAFVGCSPSDTGTKMNEPSGAEKRGVERAPKHEYTNQGAPSVTNNETGAKTNP